MALRVVKSRAGLHHSLFTITPSCFEGVWTDTNSLQCRGAEIYIMEPCLATAIFGRLTELHLGWTPPRRRRSWNCLSWRRLVTYTTLLIALVLMTLSCSWCRAPPKCSTRPAANFCSYWCAVTVNAPHVYFLLVFSGDAALTPVTLEPIADTSRREKSQNPVFSELAGSHSVQSNLERAVSCL